MVDALDVLLDDRALVEVGRHVVRGRADQLHAAVVRLVVRLGALEARQEAVVDVDRAALQAAQNSGSGSACSAPARPGRCRSSTSASTCALLRALGLAPRRRQRQVVERDAVARGQLGEVGWFETIAGDVDVELARCAAEQQVVQAVAVLAHHQQQRGLRASGWKLRLHAELLAHVVNSVERAGVRQLRRRLEVHAHEEQPVPPRLCTSPNCCESTMLQPAW
jgi:hypothetical protein